MNKPLRWLHLSDIHYGLQNFDTIRMRDRLLAILKEKVEEKPLDFIVITGDLSYQGKLDKKLTKFLDELLKAVSLKKEYLYIVPGNHDIKRDSVRKNLLNSFLKSEEEFDTDIEKELLKGQLPFFNFYKKYFNSEYPKTQIHHVIETPNYNLLCLNTALTCGVDAEEGTLKINLNKLLETVKKVNSEKLTIAIGHHSPDCFSPKDRNDIINQFIDYKIDVYLCGHVHSASYYLSADGDKQIPIITCAANIQTNYDKAGYIIGEYKPDHNISCQFFSWDIHNSQWTVNNSYSREVKNGKKVYELERFKTKFNSYGEDNDIDIDEDAFRDFIIQFGENFSNKKDVNQKLDFKNIEEKFTNMKCIKSMVNQYNEVSIYFPIITEMINTPSLISPSNKMIIYGVIIAAYNKNFDICETGHILLEAMVNDIYNDYAKKTNFSESNLKLYIKVLCYWLIYECDIFDDKKE